MIGKIKEKLTDGKTVIVVIAGLGGAWKSSISEEIYEKLSGENMRIDIFQQKDSM